MNQAKAHEYLRAVNEPEAKHERFLPAADLGVVYDE